MAGSYPTIRSIEFQSEQSNALSIHGWINSSTREPQVSITMPEQLHLAGFLIALQLTHSHAQWRHPRNNLNFLRPEYYADIARILERGKFDYVFFADLLSVPSAYGRGIEDSLRHGVQGAANIDPAYVVATMAPVTQH